MPETAKDAGARRSDVRDPAQISGDPQEQPRRAAVDDISELRSALMIQNAQSRGSPVVVLLWAFIGGGSVIGGPLTLLAAALSYTRGADSRIVDTLGAMGLLYCLLGIVFIQSRRRVARRIGNTR